MFNFASYHKRAVAWLTVSHATVAVLGVCGYLFFRGHVSQTTYGLYAPQICAGVLILVASIGIASAIGNLLETPIKLIVQALLYLTDDNVAAPHPAKSTIGRDLTESLLSEIYSLARGDNMDSPTADKLQKRIITGILNSFPLGIVVLDEAKNITFFNEKSRQLLYDPSQDPSGQPLNDAIHFLFEGPQSNVSTWLDVAIKNEIQASEIWRGVEVASPDGSQFYDVVGLYNAQESHGLEIILALVNRTEEYQHKQHEFGFVALAIHELRTPITILRGYAEVLENELSPKVSKEYADFIHKMGAAAAQLVQFTHNVLNTARVEAGQLALHPKPISTVELLSGVADEYRVWAQLSNRRLKLELAENLPDLVVDQQAVKEVLSNLLDNALKYSKQDGLIQLKATQQGSFVAVSVIDNGLGIAEPLLKNLFSRFYRSHRTSGQVSGTGLGLYLSKALVEAHGGTIAVRSTEGHGK